MLQRIESEKIALHNLLFLYRMDRSIFSFWELPKFKKYKQVVKIERRIFQILFQAKNHCFPLNDMLLYLALYFAVHFILR